MSRAALSVEEVQALSKDSFCSNAEVKRLWEKFAAASKEGTESLALEEFKGIKGFRCNPFAERLAHLFSSEGDGRLSFPRFVEMHSALHDMAPVDERIAWAFALWDFDGDDKLDASDMRRGVRMLANGDLQEPAAQPAPPPTDGVPAMFDDQYGMQQLRACGEPDQQDLLSSQEISQVLERIAREIEPLGNGISFEEFHGVVGQLPECLANFRLAI